MDKSPVEIGREICELVPSPFFVPCKDERYFSMLLQNVLHRRAQGKTLKNPVSSRSHLILTFAVKQMHISALASIDAKGFKAMQEESEGKTLRLGFSAS